MKDPDVDVRTAAVLAAGQSMSRNLTTVKRSKLDDQECRSPSSPHHDLKDGRHSGGNILIAVVNGDRRADDGLPQSIMHTVSKDLHSPSTLARIGTLQGASSCSAPLASTRPTSTCAKRQRHLARQRHRATLAGEDRPLRSTLIVALGDKDPAVRAETTKALGSSYHNKVVSNALLPLFDDSKHPVRLTAAAAYLRSAEGGPGERSRRAVRRTVRAEKTIADSHQYNGAGS